MMLEIFEKGLYGFRTNEKEPGNLQSELAQVGRVHSLLAEGTS